LQTTKLTGTSRTHPPRNPKKRKKMHQ